MSETDARVVAIAALSEIEMRIDVEDGSDGTPRPNEFMRIWVDLEQQLHRDPDRLLAELREDVARKEGESQ